MKLFGWFFNSILSKNRGCRVEVNIVCMISGNLLIFFVIYVLNDRLDFKWYLRCFLFLEIKFGFNFKFRVFFIIIGWLRIN